MPDRKFGFETLALHAGQIPDPATGARGVQDCSFSMGDRHDGDPYALRHARLQEPIARCLRPQVPSRVGGLPPCPAMQYLVAGGAALSHDIVRLVQNEDNPAMNVPGVSRCQWNDFPDVVILAEERFVKRNPEYAAAKAGDVASAKRLAARIATAEAVSDIQRLIAKAKPRLVPVHAMEARGVNRIPLAFAQLLGESLDLEVEADIVQANFVGHTGASGWARLARPPVFDGPVHPGQVYVLIDDFVGQGGTLANLRGHLFSGGARTIGAVTLTGKAYSAKLALSGHTLNALRDRHGPALEIWWRQAFGYGFDCLTESEARYLLRAEDAHTIRARIAQARSEAES